MKALIFILTIFIIARLLNAGKPCEVCDGTKKAHTKITEPDGSSITIVTERPCPVCSKD